MVNAVSLSDYEVWLFVASLAFSTAVGCFVAYLQDVHAASGHQHKDKILLVFGVVFAVLFVVFFVRGLFIRHGLRKNARTYQMSASSRVD
jgi:heme/copper-type cytochrome/quinol oxidase subunit 2